MEIWEELINAWEELSNAWTMWQSSRLPEHFILWGKSIRWWAQLGIGIQLIGAITLIVEIIGPVRIRAYGTKLKVKNTNKKSFAHLKWVINWPVHLYDIAMGKGKKSNQGNADSTINSFTLRIYSSLTGLMLMIAAIPDPSDFVIYPVVMTILSVAVVLSFSSIILAGVGVSLDIIILRPVAWVLDHKYLSGFLKILSLIAVLLGIHFSLLAA